MTITIDNVHAVVSNCEVLTSGMVGKKINLSFSDAWEGLYKIAVFDNGFVSVDVVNPSAEVTIPWEVLERPNRPVRMGVYGYVIENGIKRIAIPTIYADLGTTVRGADPYSDPNAVVTPTVAEQLIAMIGNLSDLTAEDKSNLVAAINEAAESGGGGTGDHRDLTHRDAADQHPMSAITGLLVALASKYQRPALGIPKSDLEDSVRISLGRADTALQTAPVASVNGKTGAVNLVPADLGIGSVFTLKGSKPTYADLPATGNTIGDVWYVVADSVGYIWLNDGTVDRWEQLGMEIDLAAYRTAAAQDVIDAGKEATANRLGAVNPSADSIATGKYYSASAVSAFIDKLIPHYVSNHSWSVGDYCTFSGTIYKCNTPHSNVQWTSAYWDAVPDFSKDLVDNYALKDDLDDKVDIAQGISHSGEFLVVGDDGNVTTQSLPLYDGSVV